MIRKGIILPIEISLLCLNGIPWLEIFHEAPKPFFEAQTAPERNRMKCGKLALTIALGLAFWMIFPWVMQT